MRARSMLFTLFGDYVRHYGGTIWIGSLIALMAELGFSAQAVRAAVSRMGRQGWLTPRRVGRASYYLLTPRGRDRIEEAAQRIFKLHPERWDGLWRVLVVATGGRDRGHLAALRRELTWMGWAPLSRGVYLTPNDLLDRTAALLERYGLGDRWESFTARHEGPAPDRSVVGRYWDLEAIDRAYGAFVDTWRPRLEEWRRAQSAGEVPADAASFREKTLLVHEFRKFLFVDPGLPQELLPPRWNGLEARAVFSASYHLLAEGAVRFFEHHYRPAPGHDADFAEGRRAARRDPFRPLTSVG
jgi:phenylacetic acid degradation operon negative regulatory protein